MRMRYIFLAIAIVSSVGLFLLSRAILTSLWVPPQAGFFESLGGDIDAAYYSYLGVFVLLVVGSVIGILVGWRKGRRELKMGGIFTLIFAILVTAVITFLVLR
jgi:hypothetical protein